MCFSSVCRDYEVDLWRDLSWTVDLLLGSYIDAALVVLLLVLLLAVSMLPAETALYCSRFNGGGFQAGSADTLYSLEIGVQNNWESGWAGLAYLLWGCGRFALFLVSIPGIFIEMLVVMVVYAYVLPYAIWAAAWGGPWLASIPGLWLVPWLRDTL